MLPRRASAWASFSFVCAERAVWYHRFRREHLFQKPSKTIDDDEGN